jgi:RNA polymerase sigma-70 factor (ECF subfamily)
VKRAHIIAKIRFKPGRHATHLIAEMTSLALNVLDLQEPVVVQRSPAANDAEVDDHALARAAAGGDTRAFEALYRRHCGRVYGLCVRLVDGDRARADSLAQDAFVRAWEKIGSFRGEAQFSTWLHRLTVNVVLGEHRLLKRWVSFEETAEAADPEEPGAHPQATAGLRLDLERALARLPRGARTVLMLHDIEGYQHEEIAELTGIAVGTSKAQLHRARKLMKEWLQ